MAEIDYEALVMSSLCRSETMRKRYLDKISSEDLTFKTHVKVFDALVALHQGGHTVDQGTVDGFFSDPMEKLTVNLLFTIEYKTDDGKPITLTDDYFRAFKKSGIRARQVKIRDTINKALQSNEDPELLSDKIRALVSSIDGDEIALEANDMDASADSASYLLDQWASGDRPVISGLPELDSKLFLSQFIGYWVIAGNSGAGKSAFMCNIAKENARRGIPGTICSLEMSKELLLIRMVMEDPKIKGIQLTERTIKDKQIMSDLKYAIDQFRKLPIHIVDGVYDIFRLDKISRKLAVDKGCKWTLFDYIQLGKTKPTDSDVVRVYTVSRYLQGLTKVDLPNGYHGQVVLALSQYSNEATKARNFVSSDDSEGHRGTRKKEAPKPSNSDLAWSGQIKQDADGILHIYPTGEIESPVLDVELHCGKQRNYISGWTVRSRFVKSEQRFVTDLSVKKELSPSMVPVEATRPVQF